MQLRKQKKKRWKDLSTEQRAAVSVAGAVQVGLQLAALWDLLRRPRDQVNGRKLAWAAATFINTFGPLAYFKWGRRRPPAPVP
jgi:hypothetical protein